MKRRKSEDSQLAAVGQLENHLFGMRLANVVVVWQNHQLEIVEEDISLHLNALWTIACTDDDLVELVLEVAQSAKEKAYIADFFRKRSSPA